MIETLEPLLGPPVAIQPLKHKPGRRRTVRATGASGSAIAKVYASERAPAVAGRVRALAAGPAEPVVPRLLHLDEAAHLVVLSDVPGTPLREAALAGDLSAGNAAGRALGGWHRAWTGTRPDGLCEHTAARELELLRLRAAGAAPRLRASVAAAADKLDGPWACTTVVHRDLYEEQVLVDRRRDDGTPTIGLIDVDDAALGPPELDLGNLIAHLELLARRHGQNLQAPIEALLDGYADTGPEPDPAMLARCRALTLLRLACIHDAPALVEDARRHDGALR